MITIDSLLKKLNINYKNKDFYVEALTHPSYNNEFSDQKNYQRLEFLGDTILQKHITVFLYKTFKNANEGQMSLLRSKVVSNSYLVNLAKKKDFKKYIRVGKGVKLVSDKIIVDVLEAFIGAIYIDRGDAEVEKFLKKNFLSDIKKIGINDNKDPKTILQEYLKSESRKNIQYQVENVKNKFKVSVFYNQKLFGQGVGATKKKAETSAAEDALAKLNKDNETN